MKQVIVRGGRAVVEEVGAPTANAGQALVLVAWSCISPGTESAGVTETTIVGALYKLRQNPALVRKAMRILHERGIRGVRAATRDRFTAGFAPGYSCSGTVAEIGEGVEDLQSGDRVACAGGGYASHAEVVSVPRNLIVKVPEEADLASAATVALGATALQGVRRAGVAVGERVGVLGLGIIGQLAVQLLKVAGCRVFGCDPNESRVDQARMLGMDASPSGVDGDPVATALRFTGGYGLDAVIITAATKSDEPVQQAMQMARKKGRVIVVGDVGLRARREEMYSKELDLLISTSYGPGRYDPTYEEDGLDYPYAYVPWTENRNMRTYLEFVTSGQVRIEPLIASRYPVDRADEAYAALTSATDRPYTVLIEYSGTDRRRQMSRSVPVVPRSRTWKGQLRVAVIGAGAFFRDVLRPFLQGMTDRFSVEAVVTSRGPNASSIAKQIGARWAGTDYHDALADPEIDAVMIATRHHLHARFALDALRAGKHVFVEKPLALTEAELRDIEKCVAEFAGRSGTAPVLFVGFNRRYSPYAAKLRKACVGRAAPVHVFYRMNAGCLPTNHWIYGAEGGGRVLGEACHAFDLFAYLIDAPVESIQAVAIRSDRADLRTSDNFTATLRYSDGSVCTLLYTSQGAPDLGKEYCEIHVDGRAIVLDDYRRLTEFGQIRRGLRTRVPEKGHREELQAFYDVISGKEDARVRWDQTLEASWITIRVDAAVRGRAS